MYFTGFYAPYEKKNCCKQIKIYLKVKYFFYSIRKMSKC